MSCAGNLLAIVTSLDEIIYVLDRELRLAALFGHPLERHGIAPDAFVGKGLGDLVDAQAASAITEAAQRALAGERLEHEWIQPGPGGARYLHLSLAPLLAQGGAPAGVVGILRDLTERRRAEDAALVGARLAPMSTLAGGVAHAVNNPLATIVASLEFVVRQMPDLRGRCAAEPAALARLQDVEDALADAQQAAERVRVVIRDLRRFASESEEPQASVDVNAAVEAALRMAWTEIRHRARLVKHYGRVPPVRGNESHLRQTFVHLAVNAAQAIPEGTADRNEINVSTFEEPPGRVVIEFRDTGSGIPLEIRQQIFDPFFTTRPVGQGDGIGLAVCHRVVTEHRGQLTVESEPGRGSCFRVVLPAASTPAIEQEAAPAAPETRDGRVLVVDDDESVCAAIRRALTPRHRVTTVTRAREALARLTAGEPFDVIICDLMMPEMTGIDLYEELKRTAPAQAERIVFLTAGAFTARAREFLQAVANPRMEKPFETQNLLALVDRLVRAAGSEGAAAR